MHNFRYTCPTNKVVEKLKWKNFSGRGLVDLQMGCAGGEYYHFTTHGGTYNGPVECKSRNNYGFQGIQGREQSHFGIINVAMQCTGSSSWPSSNNNMNGRWNDKRMCRSGWVITGMEVRQQTDYGIINFRARCSELLGKYEIIMNSHQGYGILAYTRI